MTRIAILGGGLSGITAAWQLAQHDRAHGGLEVTLFEASNRLGGTIETVLRDGFVIDCGPDGWVTEKPWARELIRELGLHTKLIASNDQDRVTYIASGGKLVPLPARMRMMVPVLPATSGVPHDRVKDAVRDAIVGSSTPTATSLFTEAAIAAYSAEPSRANELRASAPLEDESIASFVLRHFGEEVLTKVAAPLLSGVFGGDVRTLSVRAVMPAFVRMEQQHGSLIEALRQKPVARHLASEMSEGTTSIFTSLEAGTQSLIDRMVSELPPNWLRLNTEITAISRVPHSSQLHRDDWGLSSPDDHEAFDHIILATPAHVTRELLTPIHPRLAELHTLEATSAVSVAFAFTETFDLPKGFGFLVPDGEPNQLLAATFTDQKYPHRVPEGCRLLRAFFGGPNADAIAALPDEEITALALAELETYLGKLPTPAFHILRRWPRSLPQYAVGHLDRVAEIEALAATLPGLHLLGNAYRGVGLPDLIRQARATARTLIPERNPL